MKTAKKTIVGLLNRWRWVAAATAIVAFLIPLLTPPTAQDPTGGAGPFAPIVALCTASILFTEALNGTGLPIRRLSSIFIGIGSMASAYLWIASESEAHPANPGLLGALVLIFGFGAFLVLIVSISVTMGRDTSDGESSEENSAQ